MKFVYEQTMKDLQQQVEADRLQAVLYAQAVKTSGHYSDTQINRVKKFFNRENVYKQLKTMVSFLIPHKKNVKLNLNIGGGSFTDGHSITVGLPELFIDRSLEEIFSALRALIGHESQHINSSDFTAFVKFQQDMGSYFYKKYKIPPAYGQKVAKHLFNSVEDGRIEKILCNKLPGYKKHIQFLNGSFWESQEMKGQSELGDFLYTITTYSVTGLYPKGFKEIYKGTDLHQNMKKIEKDIHYGIDAVTCKQCVMVCHEIMEKVEDYLVHLYQEKTQEDEEFLKNMPNQSEFTTSEEKEKNNSGSVTTHFVPKKEDKKEEDKKEEEKKEEESESSSSDSGEEKEDKKEEEDKGKGKKNEEDQEDEGTEGEGQGEEEQEGEDESEDQDGSGSGKSEDEESDEETENSSKGDSDEDSNDENSDSESDEESDEETENSLKGDSDEDSDDENSDSESDEDLDENADSSPSKEQNDENPDDSPTSEEEHPEGVNQDDDNDMVMDEDIIRERMKEITDDVMEEAKDRIQEDKQKKESKSSKKGKDEEMTPEELKDVEDYYKNQYVKKFKEIKGFSNRHTLPVEIKREGMKFRKEVEKIFKNKESYNLRAQKKGILDTSNLWKFGVKDYNVFMKKGTPVTTDYVAFILQDGSGSMLSDEKEYHSSKAMSVMEEGLKGIVPIKMSTFSVDYQLGGVIHYTAKDWKDNQSSQNYSYNFHRSRRASGGNKDGYSIRIATAELLKRPEKDRILIILSDGLPSDYNRGEREGMQDVKQAVKEARKQGIHVVSLIFGTERFRDANIEAYKFMYDKNIISCMPEQITNQLVKMLKKIISR